jgi:hypothetical protein
MDRMTEALAAILIQEMTGRVEAKRDEIGRKK